MDMAEEAKRGAFPRAWQVLEHIVCQPGPSTATEIASSLNLAMPTAMRLLGTLVQEGLVEVEEDTRLYWPGPSFFRFMARASQAGHAVANIRSPLRELADATGETACLNLLQPSGLFSVVAVEEGRHPLRYVIELGGAHPLDRGAGGKAILAFLPEKRRRTLLSKSERASELEVEFVRIRVHGFATSHGERISGAVGIAAPITGPSGSVTGSVQVTLPDHRYDATMVDGLRGPLLRAAAALSQQHSARGTAA